MIDRKLEARDHIVELMTMTQLRTMLQRALAELGNAAFTEDRASIMDSFLAIESILVELDSRLEK